MKMSREARRTARELAKLSLVNGQVDPARVETISSAVVAEKPRSYLLILKEFARLIRLELEKRHAVIESPAALEASDATQIENNLQQKFGSDITTEFRVTPPLLGGLRIKFGSDVWDGSVRGRLASLSQQL